MGVTVAVTRVACNVGVGNQDIVTPDLGGLTPKAAFFVVTRAVTDGTPANHAILGIGAATAVDEQWACVARSEDGQDVTDTYRRATNDECVMILNVTAGTVNGEASFVQFIANGVRINWGDAPTAAFLLTVTLYVGTDLTAMANHFAVHAVQDNTVDVNTVGFEPGALLTGYINYDFDDTSQTQALLSHGIVTNTDPVVQNAWGIRYKSGQDTSESLAHIYDHYGATVANFATGAALRGYEFSAFDAQGFSCTTRLGAGQGDIGYLALAFGGAVDFKANIVNSPVANGNQAIADPGFTPQHVHVGLTQLQAVDTGYATGLAGSIGISTFDADDEYCNSIQDEDGQGISDTQSLSDDTVINLPQDSGAVGWVASFVSFDVNGWTWNFTQSLGTAVKWWYLAVEGETTTSTSLTTTSVSTSLTTTSVSTSLTTSTSVSTSVTTTSVSTSLTTSSSTSTSTSISTSTSVSTSTSTSTTLAHPPVAPTEVACLGQAEYQIRVRDTDGNYIAVFHGAGRGMTGGGMRSLSYRKRVRTPGGWEVRIDGDDERIALLELRREALTRLDYIFEFWRHDPAGGLDWYEDFAGFHRSDQFTQGSEGREVYVARGRGFNDLIAAEPIRYDKGSAEALKTGDCETVAKEYVDENVGPGAPAARQMSGLTVEASAGTGVTWTGDRANKALYDVLIELAEAAPGDFTIEHTGPVSFEFRWRHDQWGEDKTRDNGIRPAVIFGTQRGNVTDVDKNYSRLDEVNVCYVGGPARGVLREYVTRTTGAEDDSPWARRAVFRNASNSQTAAALNAKGDETLEKQEPKRAFSFDVVQTQATRYGRDWDVGDLVTSEFRGTDFDQKIVGVYVSMGDDGVENIQPELEDS